MVTQESITTKKTKQRSPSYPAIDLETAIARARDLWQKEKFNSTAVNVVLGHWGYAPGSSNGLVTLAALLKFSLLADEGSGNKRRGRLTELARRILLDDRPNSRDRDTAIKEAALSPTIHKELWDEYKGMLPSDENLRYELRANRGFTDSAVIAFIKELRSTWAFAKLAESATMSESGSDKSPTESEDAGMPLSQTVTLEGEGKGEGKTEARILTSQGKAVFILSGGSTSIRLEMPIPMSKAKWEQLKKMLEAVEDDFVEQAHD